MISGQPSTFFQTTWKDFDLICFLFREVYIDRVSYEFTYLTQWIEAFQFSFRMGPQMQDGTHEYCHLLDRFHFCGIRGLGCSKLLSEVFQLLTQEPGQTLAGEKKRVPLFFNFFMNRIGHTAVMSDIV